MPQVTEFLPRGAVPEAGESVVLQVDELEAIRLLDYRGFTKVTGEWRNYKFNIIQC